MPLAFNLACLLTGLAMSLTINNAGASELEKISKHQSKESKESKVRIATFNVSMEALNYIDYQRGKKPKLTGKELHYALQNGHQQIKNIAEIIQRVNPDILLLNEFDFTNDQGENIQLFLNNFLAKSQQGQTAIKFNYFFQHPVNTGVLAKNDLNGDNKITLPDDTYGFGYFPGHFGMALLSKFPIDKKNIRTFQYFKWKDMPGALKPLLANSSMPFYTESAWLDFRLSSKSHWDIPVIINERPVHILASHPTPPVFDGAENRNGRRNHDEIRFWLDYISVNNDYIYDDNNKYGGLQSNAPFVIMGDLNASSTEGDAINSVMTQLLSHANVKDPLPESQGGIQRSPGNQMAKYHTAHWQLRADYVLPSNNGWHIIDSGVFWPSNEMPEHRLIQSRKASSDHRIVWLDLQLTTPQ
jgi:endonuclease/exonuclease/phosphatase family metal-dependent hydrolase